VPSKVPSDSPADCSPEPALESPSRRDLIRQGVAAVTGGAAWLGASPPAGAQVTATPPDRGPQQGGRKFRAWVTRGIGPNRTTMQELTLRPLTGRLVVVRTEASQLCYSQGAGTLNLPPLAPLPGAPAAPAGAPPGGGGANANRALIQGHGGVGIVEAIGPEVRRARVGERVIVAVTPQCGSCYQCLRGRADMCQFLQRQGPQDLAVIAELPDGAPVFANGHIGGLAELMVTPEEWLVPVFTRASAVELAMLSCVGSAGLGTTTASTFAPVEPGSNVAVFGAGPLGLSAVQGARIMGAGQIIVVEPIRARRELALKLGATTVIDPNVETNTVLTRVRELCTGPSDNFWGGGRDRTVAGFNPGAGPDLVVEAAGGDRIVPKAEVGPDPTGIWALQNAWLCCGQGGHVVTTSIGHRGQLTLPAGAWSIMGRTHHSGQYGGANTMREIPRYVTLIERGLYDARALATTIVPWEQMLDAYMQAMERTTVASVITFG